jgi:CRP-like cAMP-binding protein
MRDRSTADLSGLHAEEWQAEATAWLERRYLRLDSHRNRLSVIGYLSDQHRRSESVIELNWSDIQAELDLSRASVARVLSELRSADLMTVIHHGGPRIGGTTNEKPAYRLSLPSKCTETAIM